MKRLLIVFVLLGCVGLSAASPHAGQAPPAAATGQDATLDARMEAVGRLTNQALLSIIATEGKLTTADDPRGAPDGNVVRVGAVVKLEDKALLAKLQTGDPSGAVRFAAEVRLMHLNGKRILAAESSSSAPAAANGLGGAEGDGRVFATHVAEVIGQELTGGFASLTGKNREAVIETLIQNGILSPVGRIEIFNGRSVAGWTTAAGVDRTVSPIILKFAMIGDKFCVRDASGRFRFLTFGGR